MNKGRLYFREMPGKDGDFDGACPNIRDEFRPYDRVRIIYEGPQKEKGA